MNTHMSPSPRYSARFGGVDWFGDLPMNGFDPGRAVPEEQPEQQAAICLERMSAAPTSHAGTRVGQMWIDEDGVCMRWGREVCFDMRGKRIGWYPQEDWLGTLPVSFYSSMAAVALAWHGHIPLHASTIVLHDRAWLLAGPAGAGKSTLAADLVSAGALLLADDLTIVSTGDGLSAALGRPTMRLHPQTAEAVAQIYPCEPIKDERGKLLIRPLARAADRSWPIGGLLLLAGSGAQMPRGTEAVRAFGSVLFRPRILAALPKQGILRRGLLELAQHVPLRLLPSVSAFDPRVRAERRDHALAQIEKLVRKI